MARRRGRRAGEHPLGHAADVADDRTGHRRPAPDPRRVDVDLDDGLAVEQIPVRGGVPVEPGAERDHAVGLGDHLGAGLGGEGAERAQVAGCAPEVVLRQEGAGDRGAQSGGTAPRSASRAWRRRRRDREQQRPAGVGDDAEAPVQGVRVGLDALCGGQCPGRRLAPSYSRSWMSSGTLRTTGRLSWTACRTASVTSAHAVRTLRIRRNAAPVGAMIARWSIACRCASSSPGCRRSARASRCRCGRPRSAR